MGRSLSLLALTSWPKRPSWEEIEENDGKCFEWFGSWKVPKYVDAFHQSSLLSGTRSSLSSRSTPLVKSRFLLDWEVKRCTMRVNHASIISSELTVPPHHHHHAVIYLRPISSSVWQSALTGSRRAGMWPCSSLDPWKSLWGAERGRPALPFLSDIRCSSLLFHFTLCGRWGAQWESGETPREALGRSLSDEIA